jgi:hypothetical protein
MTCILHTQLAIATLGWALCTSNGSGGGKTRNFAEMYVFARYKLYRTVSDRDRRRSTSYQYTHIFPTSSMEEIGGDDQELEELQQPDVSHPISIPNHQQAPLQSLLHSPPTTTLSLPVQSPTTSPPIDSLHL